MDRIDRGQSHADLGTCRATSCCRCSASSRPSPRYDNAHANPPTTLEPGHSARLHQSVDSRYRMPGKKKKTRKPERGGQSAKKSAVAERGNRNPNGFRAQGRDFVGRAKVPPLTP